MLQYYEDDGKFVICLNQRPTHSTTAPRLHQACSGITQFNLEVMSSLRDSVPIPYVFYNHINPSDLKTLSTGFHRVAHILQKMC
jgi:hypothetical protein